MIINLYAVYDKSAAAYMSPFQGINDNQAIRSFSNACMNPEAFGQYPTDYSLFKIATYNDETGKIDNMNPDPVHIITAVKCIQMHQENTKYVQSLHANQTQTEQPTESLSE